jgi:serine/threonine protein kinase
VIDVGELENGTPYMVMEFLEGDDLGAILQQEGPLSVEQAVDFVLQACEAIAEAHGHGIIHRDLKPSNLFCIRHADGRLSVKVLDFGISKIRASETSGTWVLPLYMTPEQMAAAHDVDVRADIWALGATLFELLTGRSPFEGIHRAELRAKVASEPPPPVRQCRPDAPLGIETVISKCLAKDRKNRYLSVAELAAALAPFAPKHAQRYVGRIQEVGLSASGHSTVPPALAGAVGAKAQSGEGSSLRWVLVGVVVLLIVAAGVAWALLCLGRSCPFGVAGSEPFRSEGLPVSMPPPWHPTTRPFGI